MPNGLLRRLMLKPGGSQPRIALESQTIGFKKGFRACAKWAGKKYQPDKAEAKVPT